jgi:hypothetical protein
MSTAAAAVAAAAATSMFQITPHQICFPNKTHVTASVLPATADRSNSGQHFISAAARPAVVRK